MVRCSGHLHSVERAPDSSLATGSSFAVAGDPWTRRREGDSVDVVTRTARSRLPRRGGRRHGDGVHRRADRPCRRARRPGRPAARRQRALAGGLPVRAAAPVLAPSTASRRPCSAAASSSSADPRRGCRSAPRSRRSAPTTPRSSTACVDTGTRRVLPQQRVRRRPHLRLAHLRASATRSDPGAASSTRATWPRASPRSSRRRSASPTAPGDAGQRARAARRRHPASTSSPGPARPRPTRASGCSRVAWTPTRSAGSGRASRGCSTGP